MIEPKSIRAVAQASANESAAELATGGMQSAQELVIV
jgi:hypothetical protein